MKKKKHLIFSMNYFAIYKLNFIILFLTLKKKKCIALCHIRKTLIPYLDFRLNVECSLGSVLQAIVSLIIWNNVASVVVGSRISIR